VKKEPLPNASRELTGGKKQMDIHEAFPLFRQQFYLFLVPIMAHLMCTKTS
jgi:hypothetical protein